MRRSGRGRVTGRAPGACWAGRRPSVTGAERWRQHQGQRVRLPSLRRAQPWWDTKASSGRAAEGTRQRRGPCAQTAGASQGAFLQEAGLGQGKGSRGFSRVVTGRRGRVGHRQDIPGEGTVWQEDVLGPPGLACWRPWPRGCDAGWQAACTWAHVFHTGAGSKRPRWFLELVRPPRESRALRSSLGGHTGGTAGSQDTLRALSVPGHRVDSCWEDGDIAQGMCIGPWCHSCLP